MNRNRRYLLLLPAVPAAVVGTWSALGALWIHALDGDYGMCAAIAVLCTAVVIALVHAGGWGRFGSALVFATLVVAALIAPFACFALLDLGAPV